MTKIYMVMQCLFKFLPVSGFKWIDSNEFDFNKYTSNSSKGCLIKVGFQYPKELHKVHKGKCSSIINIPISDVEKLAPNFFDKEKYVLSYADIECFLRLVLK